ncbi:uncharacterized protein BKA55DRAFT_734764 [Fusarium redolens]|uniref:F-box domain-containing protein n=1 Tax=Fusarium redolens TaxID=48865 RepID=A0A9P9HXN7_FUSRE|nr:uncharacterized protein BKA55DRAFT_734764 [Fusarium redolens]KAH7265495.1 hypothetical protein BKA55DRAFT_734764 [Fusarium redolens]
MASPTTAAVHDTVPYPKLPFDIQSCIIKSLIETHKESRSHYFRLSSFASVSKIWQIVIEKETFKHLTIKSRGLDSFDLRIRSHRIPLVKHILLEVSYGNPFNAGLYKQAQFAKAVHGLWRILSTWKKHRLTVELAIATSTASTIKEQGWTGRGGPNCDPFDSSVTSVNLPPDWVTAGPDFPMWVWATACFLGTRPLGFDRTRGSCLPKVDAIAELVIRRRYHPNICPRSLSQIISSTTCVESIHLERWCYGRPVADSSCDVAFQQSGFTLPPSMKRLTFCEEFHTPYHQRIGGMVLPRSNTTLLDSILQAADHLEHIAVSFAFDAHSSIGSQKRNSKH